MGKRKKMSITSGIIYGFGALILLYTANVFYSFQTTRTLSVLARTIHDHPLVVSNASLRAYANIIKIHSDISDVVLFKEPAINLAIAKIDEFEIETFKQLNTVQENILGDEGKEIASETIQLFKNWKPLRDKVIRMVHNGKRENAAIVIKTEGADHVAKLEGKVLELTGYARNKGADFLQKTENVRSQLKNLSIILSVLWIVLSSGVAFFIILRTRSIEGALAEEKEKLLVTLNSIGDGVIATDNNGEVILMNRVAEGLTGWSENEATGKSLRKVFNIINEQTREPCENLVEKVLAANGIVGLANHTVLISKDGTEREITDSGAPIRNRFEQIIGMVLVFRDQTEERRYKNKIIESEKKYRLLSDNTLDVIWTMNLDLVFTYINPAIRNLTGHSPEEWVGSRLPEHSDEENFVKIAQVVADEMAKGPKGPGVMLEAEILKKNGEPVLIEIHGKVIYDDNGQPASLQGVSRDITERKRAEEVLRESEEKYRLLVENADDAIFIAQDEVIKFPNPKTLALIGYSKDELSEIPFINIIHPEDRGMVVERYHQRLKGKEFPSSYSFRIINKVGDELFVQLNAALITWEDRPATINLLRDITEQKELENQLRRAQKMEAIGNLAGGIAHDFNNILTSVIGFTELSLDEVEKGTHIEDNLQEIYTAGKRAKDLVMQILAFARQSGEDLKPIQVDTIATEVLKLIRSSIPTTIEIKQTIESDALIMGNATQVHQILMNLFANAAHAMEDEGGILEFSLKDVVMDRVVTRENLDLKPGNYIEIKVSDTGTGIAPEIIGAIFDPYFTTKGPGEGTGMGLAMVHGIVKSYGGKISVDSKPGQGALFRIYLPVARKRREHHPYQSETLPTGTERILFVDDEVPITKMGGQTLEGLGYTVSIRTGSIEALELFRSRPNDFDLVITDMTMPNMSGDKLAVELMKIRPDIPVMLCTGFSKKISDDSIATIGIRAVAYKPIVKADLAKTVRKVLDDRQSKQTTGRILLIDDESEIRKLFIQKLAGRGYEIIEACNGKEGLKLYHENRPDLVITDLVMPEKEGFETITELKREFQNVKIIAISGGGRNAPDAYLQLAKNLGVDRTFTKPVDWPELIKTIRELLK
jgi:PAS domain S-box-containing protein